MSNAVEASGATMAPVDYESIEQAVLESRRGRWFLEEYAKRLRREENAKLFRAIEKLETVVTTSQEALTERLSRALGVIVPAMAPAEAKQLSPEQMMYFKQDEDIFVSPADSQKSEVTKGAKLVIRRRSEAEHVAAPAEIDAIEPPRPGPDMVEPVPLAALPAAFHHSEESARRRIVIIRHKPGEHIDVPLQDAMAATG